MHSIVDLYLFSQIFIDIRRDCVLDLECNSVILAIVVVFLNHSILGTSMCVIVTFFLLDHLDLFDVFFLTIFLFFPFFL